MSNADIHWWLNLATMIGIAILAFPVWSLNNRKKKLQEVRDALPQEPKAFKDKVKTILVTKRDQDVADWRPIDERCLWIGYVCLLGSAIIRLFYPLG